MFASLQERIAKKQALVGVIGLGYVGLPLVRSFVAAGMRVLGFDSDRKKVEKLAKGESYIRTVPAEAIADWQRQKLFEPTDQMARLAEPDAILICVPTPLDAARNPDLSYVESTAAEIAAQLRPGQLVILESTTYPGTTRELVLPLLEKRGLLCGRDFFLAYSPEREDPGNPSYTAGNIPKLVGGIDEPSQQLACALYRQAVAEVVPVSRCEVAEAAKLLENVYRAVNIALVNEMKIVLDRLGIEIGEVIAAAKTKPFGFQAFYPGPGLGGHCIPIDPFYLSWLARREGMTARFIELAGEINTAMPAYVVDRVVAALNEKKKSVNGSRIGLMGVAYKRDIDDPRESPAFRLMELLAERGAILSYHDPYIPKLPAMRHYQVPALESEPLTADWLAQQDCVLIVTDHRAIDYGFVVRHGSIIVDTRQATDAVKEGREKIRRA